MLWKIHPTWPLKSFKMNSSSTSLNFPINFHSFAFFGSYILKFPFLDCFFCMNIFPHSKCEECVGKYVSMYAICVATSSIILVVEWKGGRRTSRWVGVGHYKYNFPFFCLLLVLLYFICSIIEPILVIYHENFWRE